MKGRKIILSAIASILLIGTSAGIVSAVTLPDFTSCTNPQGSVRVTYPNGTHGVAGNLNTFTGIDTVYNLSLTTNTQCLCASDGQGIQTNWWNVSQLNQQDIDVLINQGWIYIPNGAAWGLDEAPYLAKSSDYVCRAVGGTSATNTSSDSNDTSSPTSINEILNLASTGNLVFILLVLITGISVLSLGLFLNFKKS